eukprot:scaffold2244_cov363-Pavlova_lutheri.AAC.9
MVKAMHGSNVPSSPPCEQACCSSYLTNARANGKNLWPEFRMHHTFMNGRLRCKLPSRESLAHRVFHRSKKTRFGCVVEVFDVKCSSLYCETRPKIPRLVGKRTWPLSSRAYHALSRNRMYVFIWQEPVYHPTTTVDTKHGATPFYLPILDHRS